MFGLIRPRTSTLTSVHTVISIFRSSRRAIHRNCHATRNMHISCNSVSLFTHKFTNIQDTRQIYHVIYSVTIFSLNKKINQSYVYHRTSHLNLQQCHSNSTSSDAVRLPMNHLSRNLISSPTPWHIVNPLMVISGLSTCPTFRSRLRRKIGKHHGRCWTFSHRITWKPPACTP